MDEIKKWFTQGEFIAVSRGNNHVMSPPPKDRITIITKPHGLLSYFYSVSCGYDVRLLWSFLIPALTQNHHREIISLSCEQWEDEQEIKLEQRATRGKNKPGYKTEMYESEMKAIHRQTTLQAEGRIDRIKISFPCRAVAAGLSILIECVSH